MSAPSWDELERHPSFKGIRDAFETELKEPLSAFKQTGQPHSKLPGGCWYGVIPIGLFFFANILIEAIMPDNFFGTLLHIPAFFIVFLGGGWLLLNLFSGTVARFLLQGQRRFLARSEIMTHFANRVGFTYVPAPGGAPPSLKAFAKWSGAPKELKKAAAMLDQHGGMDEALTAAKDAGVMTAPATVIGGTAEQRALFQDQATTARLEDGFTGTHEGVRFAAFEWIEAMDEAEDIHHLVIVLTAPLQLHGVTQFRSRNTSWPRNVRKVEFQDVDLGPAIFSDRFKLRSQDQTEARALFNPAVIERVTTLAHGDKIAATAFDTHIVIDIEGGGDRFNCVNLLTGAWSEETIRGAAQDVIELSDLVRETSHAFMLRG